MKRLSKILLVQLQVGMENEIEVVELFISSLTILSIH